MENITDLGVIINYVRVKIIRSGAWGRSRNFSKVCIDEQLSVVPYTSYVCPDIAVPLSLVIRRNKH